MGSGDGGTRDRMDGVMSKLTGGDPQVPWGVYLIMALVVLALVGAYALTK